MDSGEMVLLDLGLAFAGVKNSSSTSDSDSDSPSLKLNLTLGGDADDDVSFAVKRERVSPSSEDDDSPNSSRKKLRLSKTQSALLEQSFKINSSLNQKQKQELAEELKLRPRQVEVWFQNRRARTKLKQTEIDCAFLKKYCDTLTAENRWLQRQVKALKSGQPTYVQFPAVAALALCPSCERVSAAAKPSTTAC